MLTLLHPLTLYLAAEDELVRGTGEGWNVGPNSVGGCL